MGLEVKIHDAQTSILRELLFVQSAGYADLQKPTGLSSDHFNFHITKLVALDLVEKVQRGQYRLSPRGKEYANKLDTDERTIERQPKVAVILALERMSRGKRQFLFQQRLKEICCPPPTRSPSDILVVIDGSLFSVVLDLSKGEEHDAAQ